MPSSHAVHPHTLPTRISSEYTKKVLSPERSSLNASSAGIEVQLYGIQSHKAIGVDERYHAPLRRIFLRICEDVPDINHHIPLQLSAKAMNDKMGLEGLVPSLLVFGILPRFNPHSTPMFKHANRMHGGHGSRKTWDDRYNYTSQSATRNANFEPKCPLQLSISSPLANLCVCSTRRGKKINGGVRTELPGRLEIPCGLTGKMGKICTLSAILSFRRMQT